ncbi:SRPBCC family protein [Flavobacteriaceae bacterium M23B6Z8]
MPIIRLDTYIELPIEKVFDLSRSIEFHTKSTAHTQESVVAGKRSGLLNLNETVTWKAKHLGIWQKLTVRITACDPPNYFVDEMVSGAFKDFKHEHFFKAHKGGTLMKDIFQYSSPFGLLGKLVDFIFLEKYMKKFLQKRNEMLKEIAETNNWQAFIDP